MIQTLEKQRSDQLETRKDTRINEAKRENRFDPKLSKKDLTKMAAGKIAARLGRPVVLGLVTAEGLTKQAYRFNGCSNSRQDA